MAKHFALSAIESTAWAMLPSHLDLMRGIAARDFDTLQKEDGQRLKNTRGQVEIFGTVAVVPITGAVFRYANFFTEICGGATTENIIKDINTAANNPKVKSLVLKFDTPGGEATSVDEAAELIRSISAQTGKKVVGYVDGMAASAGYWWASACSELIISRTGMVGSIGAVCGYVMPGTKPDKERDHRAELVSYQSPNKRPDMATEEGRGQLQSLVNDLADVFISSAAQGRNMTAQALIEAGNHGGMLTGQKAVDAGLADRIGTLTGLIDELNGKATAAPFTKPKQPQPPKGAKAMTFATLAEMQAAHPQWCAQLQTEAVEAANTQAATQLATAKTEALAEGEKAGIETERQRVIAICGAPVMGHEPARMAALKDGSSVDGLNAKIIGAETSAREKTLAGANDTKVKAVPVDGDAGASDPKVKTKKDPKAVAAIAKAYVASESEAGRKVSTSAAVKMAKNGEIE